MDTKRHKHWHKRGPGWWSMDHEDGKPPWEDWEHSTHMPPWMKKEWGKGRRHHDERFLFARFAAAFGLLVLLGCGILAVLGAVAVLFFQSRPIPQAPHTPVSGANPARWILGLLGILFLLTIALRRVVKSTTKRYTAPLSETMKAADALAEGDLSARVPEKGSGEFRHFSQSFNRMAAALETADRQRRELLADIAHELRTPLSVIQGNLEGLRDGVYEATPEQLDLVLDETQTLSRLVDDLRLLTLAEAGQLPLDPQVLDVRQLLADVGEAFDCQAREAQVTVGLELPESLPPLVADPQRLGQVLGNLMANALRHTPRGGKVTLGASLPPDVQVPHEICLWISDTGEGIDAENLPRIFDRFWRGDRARSHEAGAGTGLGLAIAKSLIEAHGGHIWAESELGKGTTVSCILPLSTMEP